jgi:cytochrome c biogenesis protein CcdA
MYNNYQHLGKGFRVLLPYLEGVSYLDDDDMQKIRSHFGVTDDSEMQELAVLNRPDQGPALEATFVETTNDVEVAASAAVSNAEFTVVYFYSPGCRTCERVHSMFEIYRRQFSEMKVKEYNIREDSSMRLAEVLGKRFNLPALKRTVAPAVFSSAGSIVKGDITFDSLGALLARSRYIPGDDWLAVKDEELEEAGKAIEQQYSALSVGLFVGGGLLDGVNPCAFATIIFLLSYLQIAKRDRRQIVQVGAAFIIGVFIAYFVLGLGLIEVVAKINALRFAGRVLNWLLAAFAGVIMILSIRDGFRCLHGDMADMTLQLPEFLKQRIHGVIRTGARHRRYVIGAFVIGVAVSFLELACTGQVYLPMIIYMLKTSSNRAGALGYLALYNLAFILPLVIVFGLAAYGLTSMRLTEWMKKHAAAVKFGTALLFLVLILMLLFGHEIEAMLHLNLSGKSI